MVVGTLFQVLDYQYRTKSNIACMTDLDKVSTKGASAAWKLLWAASKHFLEQNTSVEVWGEGRGATQVFMQLEQ